MTLRLVIFFSCLKITFGEFVVPDALIEVFVPAGLRVSIPDIKGIASFSFHGKINEPLKNNELGTSSKEITQPSEGKWVFHDPRVELKVGDTLYYETSVQYIDGNDTKTLVKNDQKMIVLKNSTTFTLYCDVSVTTVNTQRICSGTLILNEQFSNFDRNLWTLEYKFAGKPDYEFVGYNKRNDIASVKEGFLRIRPVTFRNSFVTSEGEIDLGEDCTGIHGTTDCIQSPDAFLIIPPVGSAQITTRTKFAFRYGIVEIRARLPKGDWIYPELFLNPANEVYGPGYASGQLRVAFVQGNRDRNHILQAGGILGDGTAGRNYAMRSNVQNKAWSDDFHVFKLIWEPDQITVAVDGLVYGSIHPPEGGFATLSSMLHLGNVDRWTRGSKLAPFDQEMYLVIGVGVGGRNFEDRKDGTKPWQNDDPKGQKKFYQTKSGWVKTWINRTMTVDYVKVWAL